MKCSDTSLVMPANTWCQQSSRLLSLRWVFFCFFKGKTNKRDTTTHEVLVPGTNKGNISTSCHRSCLFFTESYRNLCPVPSATPPSARQLPWVKKKTEKKKRARPRSAVNTFQVHLTRIQSGRPHFCGEASPGASRWEAAWVQHPAR